MPLNIKGAGPTDPIPDHVAKRMERARAISNGTMPLCVVFDRQPDLDAAKRWLAAHRRKTKGLTVRLTSEGDHP